MPKNKKLNHGELAAFARHINEPADKIRRWYRNGKLNEWIKGGKIQKEKAAAGIYQKISPKQQQSQNKRWGKEQTPPQPTDPMQAEMESYLEEDGENLSGMDIYELQRRNELEKLLKARIERKQKQGDLLERDKVEHDWIQHITSAKTKVLSMKSRVANILTDYIPDKTVLNDVLTAVDECVKETLYELAEGNDAD